MNVAGPQSSGFKVRDRDGKTRPVSPERAATAAKIDANHDGLCDDQEIETYMHQAKILKDSRLAHADVPAMVEKYKSWLEGQPARDGDAYHSYASMAAELKQLADQHPDLAQLVSLGKSTEGRDVWALKISSGAGGDTSAKPGVVFTGATHAREWMSMEVPLYLAHQLVENYASDPAMKRRVDNAETWIVPMVNPDGYEYSHTQDPWWRKTRAPIYDTECPVPPTRSDAPPPAPAPGPAPVPAPGPAPAPPSGPPVAYGVDPNRNYFDGKPEHYYLYRPAGDKPCDTSDDWGASDDPQADDYRGPHAASEPEIQAMMKLDYTHPNIHGIIDHHSYGEELLRPWGFKSDPPAEIKAYDEVAARMRAAMKSPYDYHASVDDYPTTGSSENSHESNGIINFTVELAREFQPPPDQMDGLRQDVGAADFAFLDWVAEKYATPAPAPPTGPVAE